MSIRCLFDVQTGFGGPTPGQCGVVHADELVAEMARIGIDRALARFTPDEIVFDVQAANAELYADCAGHAGLVPCPILVPNTGYDQKPEKEQVEQAIRRDAGAGTLRPERDRWEPEEWCCGRLLAAMEKRCLPAFCRLSEFSFNCVAHLAERHPSLPVIFAEADYIQQRRIVALLEAFPNIHLSIGSNYVVYKGVELLVEKAGPERLLFGTGFPKAEAMSAVTMLMYAGISDEAKALIGSGNMERLMEGIQS
jgi:hypothetical protein